MKKIVALIIISALIISGCGSSTKKSDNSKSASKAQKETIKDISTNGIQLSFMAEGDYFYFKNKQWNKTLLKGVNMGLTLANTDLNNPDISYDTYLEWFNEISKMNGNTVKIFSIMNPDFYRAFYDYNRSAKNKLYLIQGIWFSEDYLYDIGDAYDEDSVVQDSFWRNIKETLDIIHGNNLYTSYGKIEKAVYDKDISKYVAGYILGLEWPAEFVQNTNKHTEKNSYKGNYLYTGKLATPFENFLCEMGDKLIEYETATYKYQVPVAFLNWQTTDSITHTNEPFEEEDAVSVNTENVKQTDKYYAGLFAAMDIYPYYPEFMNHQKEYVEYKDKNGKQNTYEAYLKDLKKQYSVPIIVAEVGLPTSRGKAHESIMGYNQGGLTEDEQGKYLSEMIESIFSSGYAGTMIFSWQEEWFKQTWNTIKYAPENPALRTPNVMSAEQGYGILAVEPGKKQVCVLDGDLSDWSTKDVVISTKEGKLYTKYDEGYLYLAYKANAKNFKDKLYIPISTLGVGSSRYNSADLKFDRNTDFVLEVSENGISRLLCDNYYDSYAFIYGKQKQVVEYNNNFSKQNTGNYNNINMFLSNEMYLPVDKTTIESKSYESGSLKKGTTDANSNSFDNTADYFIKDNVAEIRIPWYLLNVMNINEGTVVGDFYKNGDTTFEKIKSMYVGATHNKNSSVKLVEKKIKYKNKSDYHTRLKKSYKYIQNTFKKIE